MATALIPLEKVRPSSIQLNTIVMATDFSPVSYRALAYAEEFARQYSSTVHIVHVLPQQECQSSTAEPKVQASDKRVYEARILLRGLKDRFRDIPNETWLELGDVHEKVLEVCEHVKADMVVIGTQGASGFAKLCLGSVVERVLRSARCPVLTVGYHVRRKPGDKLKEIVCATDFFQESETAIPYAMWLASTNRARMTLLHVVRAEAPKTHVTQIFDAYKSEFERMVRGQATSGVRVRFGVEFNGSVPDGIHDYAERENTGLIVLGIREAPSWVTHLPYSTTQTIVALAPCPVLTVRNSK